MILSAYKSILLHSSALFVRNGLHELTIYAPIFEHTLTNVHLSARYVAKHSHASTTGSDMRDYTPARRSSSVAAIYHAVANGDADAVSPGQMLWVDISDPKLVESVSNRFWTKKPQNENVST